MVVSAYEEALQKRKQIDYFQEIKKTLNKPKNKDANSKLNNHTDWINDLKSKKLSKEDKIERIRIKAEAMESKAKYFEIANIQNNIKEQYEVNQLYLDSIKAKMAILD